MSSEGGERPVRAWQWAVGAALLVGVALFLTLDWHRFLADFIPPDASRVGPNMVASVLTWAFVLVVAVLVWPPARRRLHRFIDEKTAPLHEHLAAIRAHHAAHAETLDEVRRRLDHIITHDPDIPDLPPQRPADDDQ